MSQVGCVFFLVGQPVCERRNPKVTFSEDCPAFGFAPGLWDGIGVQSLFPCPALSPPSPLSPFQLPVRYNQRRLITYPHAPHVVCIYRFSRKQGPPNATPRLTLPETVLVRVDL